MASLWRQPVWLWMNLLSLDAPLVALIWQDFLARCYATEVLPQGRWVLGLTVWAIYIADRLLDVRMPPVGEEGSRHRFYRTHATVAAVSLAVIVSADLFVTVVWVKPAVMLNGIFIAVAAAAYLSTFTGHGRKWAFWKKSCAAVLFTAGVFLVAWSRMERPASQLLWPAVSFALLCKANLVLIEHWERRWPVEPVWISLILFAVFCMGAGHSRWYCAIAVSSVALAALALAGERLSQNARRVLADVALMSPLLLR